MCPVYRASWGDELIESLVARAVHSTSLNPSFAETKMASSRIDAFGFTSRQITHEGRDELTGCHGICVRVFRSFDSGRGVAVATVQRRWAADLSVDGRAADGRATAVHRAIRPGVARGRVSRSHALVVEHGPAASLPPDCSPQWSVGSGQHVSSRKLVVAKWQHRTRAN